MCTSRSRIRSEIFSSEYSTGPHATKAGAHGHLQYANRSRCSHSICVCVDAGDFKFIVSVSTGIATRGKLLKIEQVTRPTHIYSSTARRARGAAVAVAVVENSRRQRRRGPNKISLSVPFTGNPTGIYLISATPMFTVTWKQENNDQKKKCWSRSYYEITCWAARALYDSSHDCHLPVVHMYVQTSGADRNTCIPTCICIRILVILNSKKEKRRKKKSPGSWV